MGDIIGDNPPVPPEILAEEMFYEPGIPNSVPPGHLVNFKLAPREYLLQCPYDLSHRILSYRMERHLSRCRKNDVKDRESKGLVVRFQICPHNDFHIVHEKESRYHAFQCSYRYELPDQRKDFLRFIPTLEPHPEVQGQVEDWDEDCHMGLQMIPKIRSYNNKLKSHEPKTQSRNN